MPVPAARRGIPRVRALSILCRRGLPRRQGRRCFLQTRRARRASRRDRAVIPVRSRLCEAAIPREDQIFWRLRSSYVAALRRRSSRKSFDIACFAC